MTRRTYNGPLVDVAGAVDLHCHPYPDLFPRLADDFDIVRAARDAGMKAILLKCHHENTVSRAYLVQRVIPGIRVFGPPADRRTGIVSFELENVHPHDVAQILNWEGVAVRAGHHSTQPLMTRLGVAATTRASFYLYSLPEDVDRLVAGLRKVKDTFGV